MHSDLIKMIIAGLAALAAICTLSIMHVLMVPKSALSQRQNKQRAGAAEEEIQRQEE